MRKALYALADYLVPGFRGLEDRDRLVIAGNLFSLLLALPFAVLGLVWLARVTDIGLVLRQAPVLVVLLGAVLLLERMGFLVVLDPTKSQASFSGSLSSVVTWSAILVFGPSAIWLDLPYGVAHTIHDWRRESSDASRWTLARSLVIQLANSTLGGLAGLAVYEALGGAIPFPGFGFVPVVAALAATGVSFAITVVGNAPLLGYLGTIGQSMLGSRATFFRTLIVLFGLGAIAQAFGILAAGIYVVLGLGAYLLSVTAVAMTSLLANRLSRAITLSAQRALSLQRLEELGRELIIAPADASHLNRLLARFVPGMFPLARMEIRLFPDRVLFRDRDDWPEVPAEVWAQLRAPGQTLVMLPGLPLLQRDRVQRDAVLVPINDARDNRLIGGIYAMRGERLGPIGEFAPVAQTLAAQISSALLRAQAYEQALAYHRTEQELSTAWKIQASFLPDSVPEVPGWELSASLDPARQTSGDFYDFIPLPGGRLGVVIADVADKGMGAALFMALSRTLIRTYASDNPDCPEDALVAANRRIVEDTRSDMFVTVFFGVLDPATGLFRYSTAGHNPPVWMRRGPARAELLSISRGLPLGVFPDIQLRCDGVQLEPGDRLVLYTDGVTEAQNAQGEFFETHRLLRVTQGQLDASAAGVRDAIVTAVHDFAGDAPQFDDIALVVVARQPLDT